MFLLNFDILKLLSILYDTLRWKDRECGSTASQLSYSNLKMFHYIIIFILVILVVDVLC